MIRSTHSSLRRSGIASVAVVGLAIAMTPTAGTAVVSTATASVTHSAVQFAGPSVASSPITRARADAAASTATSETWFGYAADAGGYTSVESTWVVPTVDCSKGAGELALWVGLDGWTNNDVEQTGTEAYCSIFGQASYSAWWETYPTNATQTYSDTVDPGDTVTAKVTFEGSDKYELYLTDQTQGWTEDNVQQAASGAANLSAEVIGETPDIIPGYLFFNLPDFGTTTFTNSQVDGQPIGDANPFSINLVRSSGTLATTGALNNGTDFTSTWDANA